MRTGFFAFDVETTGLDATQYEIISLAATILDEQLQVVDQKVFYALPEKAVDPKALEINGFSLSEWKEKGALSQYTLAKEIHKMTKDYHELIPLGHNVGFDLTFLKALYTNNGLEKDFNRTYSYLPVDTVSLAVIFDLAKFGKKGFEYKLENLCQRFGISLCRAHDALDDINATIELFKFLVKAFNGEISYEIPKPTEYKTFLEQDDDGDWVFVAGKYKEQLVKQVAGRKDGYRYIRWMLSNVGGLSPEQVSALKSSVSENAA